MKGFSSCWDIRDGDGDTLPREKEQLIWFCLSKEGLEAYCGVMLVFGLLSYTPFNPFEFLSPNSDGSLNRWAMIDGERLCTRLLVSRFGGSRGGK